MELLGTRRKEIKKAVRSLTPLSSIEMERVVLHRLAMSDFSNHFQVVTRPLLNSVPFQFMAEAGRVCNTVIEFIFDRSESSFVPLGAGHEEFLRVNPCLVKRIKNFPSYRVTDLNLSDAIEVELNAQRVISARHPYIQYFAT